MFVVAGLGVSWYLNDLVDPSALKPVQGIGVFALLYVLANGLERFMEPPASWVGSTQPERVARIRRSQRR